MSSHSCCSSNDTRRGVEHAAVIDLLVHDAQTDEVTLAMIEPRPWDGSEFRLFQLQEKLNAYLSFALDGELEASYPTLAGKRLRLKLECVTNPDEATLHFLTVVREQVGFQGIEFEVHVAGVTEGCGSGCGCAAGKQ